MISQMYGDWPVNVIGQTNEGVIGQVLPSVLLPCCNSII